MHKVMSAINDVIKNNNVALGDRSKLIEMMVSELIAAALPMPTSPVEVPKSLFLTQHKVGVLAKLHLVNEIQVIDVENCADKIYNLWLIRYKLVYQPTLPSMKRLVHHAFATNNNYLSPVYAEIFAKYPNAFLSMFDQEAISSEVGNV